MFTGEALGTHEVDAGDQQAGTGHSAIQHLKREVAVLITESEALHDATREVLQRPCGETRLQALVATVQPATGITLYNGRFNASDTQHSKRNYPMVKGSKSKFIL